VAFITSFSSKVGFPMMGLAAVFHVLSAVALAAIVYGFLYMKAQRDTLRRLLASARPADGPRRLEVGTPRRMVDAAAAALGIPVEDAAHEGKRRAVRRDFAKVEFGPFMDLFLRRGISLLRWTPHTQKTQGATCGLEVVTRSSKVTAAEIVATEAALRASLGGDIVVRILQE